MQWKVAPQALIISYGGSTEAAGFPAGFNIH